MCAYFYTLYKRFGHQIQLLEKFLIELVLRNLDDSNLDTAIGDKGVQNTIQIDYLPIEHNDKWEKITTHSCHFIFTFKVFY